MEVEIEHTAAAVDLEAVDVKEHDDWGSRKAAGAIVGGLTETRGREEFAQGWFLFNSDKPKGANDTNNMLRRLHDGEIDTRLLPSLKDPRG